MIDGGDVQAIRDASRRLVRALGFMRPTLAGTRYHASAVHAIIEIGRGRGSTAAHLVALLDLDKSSVSRMIRKLIEAGEVAEAVSDHDGRAKTLTLTAKGRATLAEIDDFATRQVVRATGPLDAPTRRDISAGLAAYAEALENERAGRTAAQATVEIERGYRPGIVGRCAAMHAAYYSRTARFGAVFEAKVAAGLAEFVNRLDRPRNAIWTAIHGGEIVGTIAIDGEDLGRDAAHLRWFIVGDGLRGHGIGRRLIGEAVGFCDEAGFAETELWTFAGLDAARHLYESAGFVLVEESPGSQWGTEVLEQRYVRPRP